MENVLRHASVPHSWTACSAQGPPSLGGLHRRPNCSRQLPVSLRPPCALRPQTQRTTSPLLLTKLAFPRHRGTRKVLSAVHEACAKTPEPWSVSSDLELVTLPTRPFLATSLSPALPISLPERHRTQLSHEQSAPRPGTWWLCTGLWLSECIPILLPHHPVSTCRCWVPPLALGLPASLPLIRRAGPGPEALVTSTGHQTSPLKCSRHLDVLSSNLKCLSFVPHLLFSIMLSRGQARNPGDILSLFSLSLTLSWFPCSSD